MITLNAVCMGMAVMMRNTDWIPYLAPPGSDPPPDPLPEVTGLSGTLVAAAGLAEGESERLL